MKKIFLFISVAALCAISCTKTVQPVDDADKWINDESLKVPVQFASGTQVETKAINYGRIEGNVMNTLDVGVIAVAEKQSDGTPVVWSESLSGSILIDNTMVTTSETGEIVFTPAVYYPYGNVYAYSFYSYYPYTNAGGQAAANVGGTYSITYDLGNNIIRVVSTAPGVSNEMKFEYDKHGNMILEDYGLGNITRTEYIAIKK